MTDRRRHGAPTITYHIGQTAGGAESLDSKPEIAHFVWKDGQGQAVASRDFTRDELRDEIAELDARGEDASVHSKALAEFATKASKPSDGT